MSHAIHERRGMTGRSRLIIKQRSGYDDRGNTLLLRVVGIWSSDRTSSGHVGLNGVKRLIRVQDARSANDEV